MYDMLALLPESSDFTLDKAVEHFSQLSFPCRLEGTYTRMPVRAERATREREQSTLGFRIFYGDWAAIAWLEAGEGVLGDNQMLAQTHAIAMPAPANIIGECSRRLTIGFDEEVPNQPDVDSTDYMVEYTIVLEERFGALILDLVADKWWTQKSSVWHEP